ncbi:ABC transporter permease [Thermanaerothrix sp.]|jgi:simple sugar transport system permease protein|uniref:ABC transporter permease n=1 Tax=Thermanaerothrix sp. TaxID=2972675 RepID=UPI003C7CB697
MSPIFESLDLRVNSIKTVKRILRTNEFSIGVAVVILSILTGVVNPAFFSTANLFDILRNATIFGILAMGVLIVIISGGIDISFPAIAALSTYATVKVLINANYQGSVLLVYAIAASIGLFLGLINAFFISWLKIPTLIVTLGTSSMYYGFNLFFVGSLNLYNLPGQMIPFSRIALVTVQDPEVGLVGLHPAVLIMVAVALLVWWFLKYTMIGRGIFAMGGNREVAERSGFNLRQIEYVIYGIVGVLSAIAGVTQATFVRHANPAALMGTELDVIAAVVLGGAAITGGRGSVIGSLLGVLFVTIMKTSLIMLGIPAYWQKVFVGIALVIGTAIPAIRARHLRQQMVSTITD